MRANSFYCRLGALLRQDDHRRSRETYSDSDIAFTLLWAERHRQPVSWACRHCSYPSAAGFVPPSPATMSRRGNGAAVLERIEQVRRQLAEAVPATPLKSIDSRPLIVGNSSGDRDARRGRAGREMARGYRLCVITSGGIVRAWTIDSLNVNDQVLAARLLPALAQPWAGQWGYLVGDNGFDGNALYDQAAALNHQFVAPPRESNRGVRDLKRNSPWRIRGLDHSDSPLNCAGVSNTFGSGLLQERRRIEAVFGHSTHLGLRALPPWIRTKSRVRRHVACQLLLLAMRQLELRQAKAA